MANSFSSDNLLDILKVSAKAVSDEYWGVEINGKQAYRERIYCYELYHQLRNNVVASLNILHAGHNKSSYLLIPSSLKNVKPDFIIHVPGSDNNYLVMEVKPSTASKIKFTKDFINLSAFISSANSDYQYKYAILLIYGTLTEQKRKFLKSKLAEYPGVRIFAQRLPGQDLVEITLDQMTWRLGKDPASSAG